MFKKFICGILAIVMVISAAPIIGAAEVEETAPFSMKISGSCVTVSGVTNGTQEVGIEVYNPGYTAQDIYSFEDKLSVIAYADQMTSCGSFEFDFQIPEIMGDFTVKCIIGDTAYEQTLSNYEFADYIVNQSFEEYSGGALEGWNCEPAEAASAVVLDGEYGNALKLDGEYNAGYMSAENTTEGGYLLGFDIFAAEGTERLYFETVDESGFTYPVFGIDTDGRIGVCKAGSYGEFVAKTEPVCGKILHINVFISMEQRCYIVYADNVCIAQKDFESRLSAISGFNFFSREKANSLIVDNFKMAKLDSNYTRYLNQKGIKLPVFAELLTDVPGNIYFNGDNTAPQLRLGSITGQNEEIKVKITASNRETGEIMQLDSFDTVLNGYKQEEARLDLSELPFGLFDLTAEVLDDVSKFEGKTTVKLARVDRPADGVKNKKAFIQLPQMYNDALSLEDTEAVFSLIDKAGYGGVRGSALWMVYEKTKGEYKLPQTASFFLDSCIEKGIDVMTVLGYDNAAHYGTIIREDENKTESIDETALAAFKNYLVHIIDDTKAATRYYEMWNEPDLEMERSTYAELIKEIYPFVKDKAPELPFGGCVMSQGTENSRLWCTDEVLNKYDGALYMDAVTVHSYATYPERRRFYMDWFWADDIYTFLDETVSKANAARKADDSQRPDLKKWSTEFGWYTSTENCVDVRTQTEYSVRAYMFLQAMGMEVVVQHTLLELDDAEKEYYANKGSASEGYYGILESVDAEVPFYAKPAFAAICGYNARTAGAEQESFSENGGIYTAKYKKDNRVLYALWTDSGESTVAVNGLGSVAALYDLYGNKTYKATNNGMLEVDVSESVVYIEECDETAFLEVNGELFDDGEYSFEEIESLGFVLCTGGDEDLSEACAFAAYYGADGRFLNVKKYAVISAYNSDGAFCAGGQLEVPAEAELLKVFFFESEKNPAPICLPCILKNKEDRQNEEV